MDDKSNSSPPPGLPLVDAPASDLLSTGDMARLCESTLRTVRFYEEEGLIRPVARGSGGHRYFPRSELQKLQLALDLREAGLSLSDIKSLFELKSEALNASQASEKLQGVLEQRIADMQRKIAKLRRLREELASVVAAISECHACDGVGFPSKCGDCDVMKHPELPRAMRVLWTE